MKILKKAEAENIHKKNNLEDWCYENNRLDLLEEWDYEKNDLRPFEVSYGTHNPGYWICNNGHSYKANIHHRTILNSGCPYCTNRMVLLGYNDFATWCRTNNMEELLMEWDYEKNEIKPTGITYGSNKKIMWKCEKQHSYDMFLKHRTSNEYGCPFCSNHRLLKGFNDFETWCKKNSREDLLAEWDYEKNEMTPNEIVYTYAYKIWWKCRHNHSYHALLISRSVDNTGCPYCTNKKVLTGFNDFASWCIKNDKNYLLEEWDYEKNKMPPTEVMRGNKKKFWWICKKNHSYPSSLNSRTTHNNGCPYCANQKLLTGFNDFATWCIQNNRKELLDEWDYKRNEIKPTEITISYREPVWWSCKNHQSYQSTVSVHRKGKGCPICLNRRVLSGYNDFQTWCIQNNRNDLLDEWNYSMNTLKPTDVTYGSQESINWSCKECGCKWSSRLKSRTGINNTGCPHCNQSKGEKRIATYLSLHNIKYEPQYKFSDCRNINTLPFDFAIFIGKKILIVEYDGEQHYIPIPFDGNMDEAKKRLIETKKHDKIKTEYCINNSIPLLRIPYKKFEDIEKLLENFIKKYE